MIFVPRRFVEEDNKNGCRPFVRPSVRPSVRVLGFFYFKMVLGWSSFRIFLSQVSDTGSPEPLVYSSFKIQSHDITLASGDQWPTAFYYLKITAVRDGQK